MSTGGQVTDRLTLSHMQCPGTVALEPAILFHHYKPNATSTVVMKPYITNLTNQQSLAVLHVQLRRL